jgi:hypothetical protein
MGLLTWIRYVWSIPPSLKGISHQGLLPNDPPPPLIRKAGAKIVRRPLFGFVFACISKNTVNCVSLSGKFFVWKLNESNFELTTETDILGDFDIYSLDGRLFVSSKMNQILQDLAAQKKYFMQIDWQLIAVCYSKLLCCPNAFEIREFEGRVLCESSRRIIALTASSTFKRIVSATLDNSLHFCSGRTGKEKVQAINVEDGITGLLITEKLGFVLVHSDRRIMLYALCFEWEADEEQYNLIMQQFSVLNLSPMFDTNSGFHFNPKTSDQGRDP